MGRFLLNFVSLLIFTNNTYKNSNSGLMPDGITARNPVTMFATTVYDEIGKEDFYKSLYLLAFNTYEGFENL